MQKIIKSRPVLSFDANRTANLTYTQALSMLRSLGDRDGYYEGKGLTLKFDQVSGDIRVRCRWWREGLTKEALQSSPKNEEWVLKSPYV